VSSHAARCAAVRERLFLGATAEQGEDIALHLRECSDCATFARRRAFVHRALREDACSAQPGSGFPERVVARLNRSSTEILGWAALKLLPAAIVTALVLAWLAAGVRSRPDLRPTDNLVSWAYEMGQRLQSPR
jgi:hypothetical protein